MQDGTTVKMIFSVAELVAFLSTGMTLVPGDVIITGTPPGVGMARDPQLWLKHGDEVTHRDRGPGRPHQPRRGGVSAWTCSRGSADVLPEDRIVSEGDELERHGGGIFTYHAPHPA